MNEQELLQQEVPQHARRTAARLFAQLKGQRVRLAIVVVSLLTPAPEREVVEAFESYNRPAQK